MVRNEHNTPVIIKYPFWQMTAENPNAVYVCINQGQASCPAALGRRGIALNANLSDIFSFLTA